ncbi:hypothetical protein MVEN_00215400 [Mycena venus]|uniref:C2H2-type domain-containing protein n=1 Tax=Mycena venus TaxID=2733690 RepID=A0A8H6YXH8_9AGAR|nr:hypothetical protein MVEN_00215400 [Mycena venus]
MAPATIDLKKSNNLAAFKNALEKAPKVVLERSILEGAQSDSRVAKIFWDALVATDSSSKEKIARFETCRHCKHPFDSTTNDHDSCAWHYGNLVIDEAFWVEQYGPTDTKENRKEYPQSFFWDCCGLQLNADGCLETKHAPFTILKKKGRVLEERASERTTARNYRDIYDHDMPAPPPTKKRKLKANAATKCRACGEHYDESKNTKRVCHWHEFDAVRLVTDVQEDSGSDEDSDGDEDGYQESIDEGWDDDSDGRKRQWTCCGSTEKGGGCIVTQHLPPRLRFPKEEAEY